LLGVPESDHAEFREALLTEVGTIGSSEGETMHHSPLEYLYGKFAEYISDRRANGEPSKRTRRPAPRTAQENTTTDWRLKK